MRRGDGREHDSSDRCTRDEKALHVVFLLCPQIGEQESLASHAP
jgi:hypothetical protein